MHYFRKLLICCTFLFSIFNLSANDINVMHSLVKRLIPEHADRFIFKNLPNTTVDSFYLSTVERKVIIYGNNVQAMAVGLNYYLNNYCHTTVSWYAEEPVIMPNILPMPDTIVSSRAVVAKRFFLNYCTYGYSMAFFTWKDWERMLDWMVLQGINMPLITLGQEYIYYNLWKSMGMSSQEILNYFTGPAYLPWHRMANIDSWNGPLPMEWLIGQKELQQKVLKRARSMDMTPVLPAFSGHVPYKLKEIYPYADIQQLGKWAGFDDKYRCYFLNPSDSLFTVIQKKYLEMQASLYGTDHIYGIDPFNEVDPPCWDSDYLSEVSKNIYETLIEIDPQAQWLQMAWMFNFDKKKWTPPLIKAFLTGVPESGMVMLDYYCENVELWKSTDSFHNQPFIWCYLGNFGGNTVIQGNMKESSKHLDVLFQQNKNNLLGIGSTLEGLDVQQFPYEYILGKAWTHSSSDRAFIENIAYRHCGYYSQSVAKAWQILFNDIYIQIPNTYAILPCLRPVLNSNHAGRTKIKYSDGKLRRAWQLLSEIPHVEHSALKIDLIMVGRQVLGNLFAQYKLDFDSAYVNRDVGLMQVKHEQMMQIIAELDQLTSYNERCGLKHWIDDARAMGRTKTQSDYYEKNARNIITTWGGTLNDYASRGWSGLFRDYYAKRWQIYCAELIRLAKNNETFDAHSLEKKMINFEMEWVNSHGMSNKIYSGDVLSFSKLLVEKYVNN